MNFNFSQEQLILAAATAIGAFSRFPQMPRSLERIYENELVQWALVFVFLWQGGGSQSAELSLLMTVVFYVVFKVLHHRDALEAAAAVSKSA